MFIRRVASAAGLADCMLRKSIDALLAVSDMLGVSSLISMAGLTAGGGPPAASPATAARGPPARCARRPRGGRR
ncbi:hypothetical protein [Gordonia malaquae]|uniref:hypothetical protein n=1 Tax=Gordonia malaquae TaxID=410332 RepID=UPI0012F88BB0|nr:hypothetical protein [Gordonia malaquae]